MTREDHLLVILAEECAEVAKNVTKALRFGLDDHEPGSHETNRSRIEDELRDLLEAARMLEAEGAISPAWRSEKPAKRAKVERYLSYSQAGGRLS